jgi:hypothetical protein
MAVTLRAIIAKIEQVQEPTVATLGLYVHVISPLVQNSDDSNKHDKQKHANEKISKCFHGILLGFWQCVVIGHCERTNIVGFLGE